MTKRNNTAVNAAAGVIRLAFLGGCVWASFAVIGAFVSWVTLLLGGKPTMWALFTMRDYGNNPSFVHIGFSFILFILCAFCYIAILISILVAFGKFFRNID